MSIQENTTKILCFSNHKGGVGKTCSSCNVGAGLALRGQKVLLVDLDPQANLSMSLGLIDTEENIYRAITGRCSIEQATFNITENLDIVPSALDLAAAEAELVAEPGREYLLKEILDVVKHKYDYILIDCSPSIGLLTTNALTAADEVFIPLQAQYLSLQGISKLTEIVSKIQKRINKNLTIGGVFITQYDSRKVLNRDIADIIEKHFSDQIFKTKIRDNVSLAEAPGKHKDIFRYNSKCYGAQDYADLCEEILLRVQNKMGVKNG